LLAVVFWNKLPVDILLLGDRDGRRIILKDVQRLFLKIMTVCL